MFCFALNRIFYSILEESVFFESDAIPIIGDGFRIIGVILVIFELNHIIIIIYLIK